LYRVFETKEELVDAVVEDAADPAPFLARLDVIDPAQPLEERLLAVVSAFHERFREVFEILVAVGMPGPPESLRRRTGGHGEDDWRVGVRRRVVALLEPDADRLAISPERLAQYVRLLSFSGAHPHITAAEPLTPAEIVDVVLHGVLRRGCPCCCGCGAPTWAAGPGSSSASCSSSWPPPWRRSRCRASTAGSSTTAWRRETPATSCAPAR